MGLQLINLADLLSFNSFAACNYIIVGNNVHVHVHRLFETKQQQTLFDLFFLQSQCRTAVG